MPISFQIILKCPVRTILGYLTIGEGTLRGAQHYPFLSVPVNNNLARRPHTRKTAVFSRFARRLILKTHCRCILNSLAPTAVSQRSKNALVDGAALEGGLRGRSDCR